jgi:hypothetical protein
MNILLHLFRRWICLPIAVIFWIIGNPINCMSFLIFQAAYWFISAGRNLMNDSTKFLNYSLK